MKWLFYFWIIFLSGQVYFAQKDTVHLKLPKHYFKSIVVIDYYQKPPVNLNENNYIAQKIQSYQIQQSTFAFNIPVYTKDYANKDSSTSNFNLLFTGYFLRYNPNFSGLPDKHLLSKNGLGIRIIYNNGKRSIFFADFSPFSTFDKVDKSNTRVIRMASLLLWSYSISPKFNFRLGLTKSFMWGNRYYLPFIGLRIGSINKTNFSIQFPRIISLNVPITHWLHVSLFTKPQGGLFSLSNKDTLYPWFYNKNKVIYLGRYEFLSGLRIDMQPFQFLSIYIAAGQTINNYLALYSLQFNRNRTFSYGHFFESRPGKTPFINLGIISYFGKTKSYYQRKNIDEQIYLNNQMGIGDENTQIFQSTNNSGNKKFKTSNEEISDLINTFDY